MLERLKYWVKGHKDCSSCCLGCPYYEQCREDNDAEMSDREAYERDMYVAGDGA